MSNLQAGTGTEIKRAAVERFASQLRGELIRPGDAEYEQARLVWNGMIDRRPALVARPTNAEDVATAIRFAREHDLLVAVRGGGHNVAGLATCDGGLVIDMSRMKHVEVDTAKRTVRAGAGANLGDLDRATQQYGLAVPAGVVSDTGIAGLTLGGGFGWLRNKYGLTSDNLISADVVTADGRFLRASETENADLLWGLRGGGGNFGIVTTFEYRAYPLGPEVYFVFVFHHGKRTGEALRFYRDYTAAAPDEVSSLAFCGVIPEAEPFPAEIHGTRYVAFGALYAGPIAEGERILRPLRDFSEPLADWSGAMPFLEVQKIFDEDYPRYEMRYYWKSVNLHTTLSDATIERIVAHAAQQPSPLSTTDIWPVGGAVARVAEESTAYSGRHVPFMVNPEANWVSPEDDGANLAWVRAFVKDMDEFADKSRYFNFPGFLEEGEASVRDAFGKKYARLVALKDKYDPTNVFRLNQNVKPSG